MNPEAPGCLSERLRGYGARAQRLRSSASTSSERLRAYGTWVATLRAHRPAAVGAIGSYGERARELIAGDARTRWAALQKHAGLARLRDEFSPSVLHLADVALESETRFSLLLAALLDPVRAGPLAHRLWPALLSRLAARTEGEARERLAQVLTNWSADLLARLQVDPLTHGAEWNNLDIFARVVDEAGLRFGLVIENKVRADTEEQPRQLARYHELLAGHYGDGVNRTVFIFLTEAPRPMTSAEGTAAAWFPMLWADVAACLGAIAADLTPGWQALALASRDAVRSEVLGLRTAESLRRELLILSSRVEEAGTDAAWLPLHRPILAIHAALGDLE